MTMNQKKDRMKQAQLARAYMNGGTTPYLAARKCGFLRVSLMEEAIDELEKQEMLEKKPSPMSDDSAYLPKAAVVIGTRPPSAPQAEEMKPDETEAPKIAFKPLQVWKNDLASVAHYGQNDGRNPMFRLRLEGVKTYLEIPETHIKDAAKILCEAAGLNGPDSNSESKEARELKPDNSDRVAVLEAALFAEKEAHNALKLKVFDKLLAHLD